MELWITLAIISAITFAIGDILAKKYMKKYDTSPKQLMFEQYLFIGTICLFFLLPFVNFEIFTTHYFLFILKAFFLGLSTLIYTTLLKKYQISLVSPLLNLSPMVLIIFTSFILSESISFIQFIGILITIIATYLLEVTHHHHNKKEPHEHHFRNLFKKPSAFFMMSSLLLITLSLTAIFDKMILNTDAGVFTNLFFTAAFILLFIVIYLIKVHKLKSSFRNIIDEPQTLIVSVFKFLDQIVILLAFSVPGALVSIMIPLRRMSTLFSSLFGGLMFHEQHMFKKLIAIVLMLVGVGFIVL